MRIWPLFFAAASLFATVNEPARIEISSGYRNDRIHWHLENLEGISEPTYSELNRDVQFWENALTLKTIYRDLSFFLRGSYGAFGRGTLYQQYGNLPNPPNQPQFQFDTSGWASDVVGYFGYAVNLTDGRVYKLIFTPLLGFSGHFEQLERNHPQPNPLQTDNYSMTSAAKDFHLTWYGFFLGGGFTIEPVGRLILNVGYTYHWLHGRLHTGFANDVAVGSPLTSEQSNSTSFTAKNGGMGQTGWAQLDYKLDRFWRAGIGGQIHYFSTDAIVARLHQQTETLFPSVSSSSQTVPQNLKLRWTSISGWVQLSRQF